MLRTELIEFSPHGMSKVHRPKSRNSRIDKDNFCLTRSDSVDLFKLKKGEAIYSDFFLFHLNDSLKKGRIVEINFGKKSPRAEFLANEFINGDLLDRLFEIDNQDFTVKKEYRKPNLILRLFTSGEIIVLLKPINGQHEEDHLLTGMTTEECSWLVLNNTALSQSGFPVTSGAEENTHIILEGYGPWDEEFKSIKAEIRNGKSVNIVKKDQLNIGSEITFTISPGKENEVILDFTILNEADIDEITPPLVSFFLNNGYSVAFDEGFIEPDEVSVDSFHPSTLDAIASLVGNFNVNVEAREIPSGTLHRFLIFSLDV